MNLHEMVRGMIGIVNPNVTAIVWKSKGKIYQSDGTTKPDYYEPKVIEVQIQSAEGAELTQIDNINQQDERKVVFAPEQLYGIDRERDLGGDLLEFYGRKWLVVKRVESWEGSNWCKVLVVSQLDQIEDDTDGINSHDNRE